MMTILKIFHLEGEEANPVSTLQEGEHIIGRGETLNCNDKRVSRKHALIYVQREGVSIKSVHVNPCFFKAANGRSIEILKKDDSVSLNDGDNFALLADAYWYRVKIINSDQENYYNPDKEVQDTVDPIDVRCEEGNNVSMPLSNSSKRCHIDDNSSEACKRTKISDLHELASIDSSVTLPLSSPSHKASTSKENVNESTIQHIPSVDLDDLLSSSSNVNVANTETKVLLDSVLNIINQDNANRVDTVKEEISDSEESVDFLEAPVPEGNVKTDENTSVKVSTDENASVKVKTETGDVDKQVKGEPSNADNKVEERVNNTNANAPSVSADTGNQQQSSRRDRCWYGPTCYRKNPTHRADFSHPGDPEYDDVPADDRPDCPFGSACYRTNLLHRRQYKHSSKPAPKPSNQGPVVLNTVTNSPGGHESSESENDDNDDGLNKKRKAATTTKTYNESPIDDYDFNDPFIDDASSDEFQISEDDDNDSTDWEDSQKDDEEIQERKRLMKEARAFTKKKKTKK